MRSTVCTNSCTKAIGSLCDTPLLDVCQQMRAEDNDSNSFPWSKPFFPPFTLGKITSLVKNLISLVTVLNRSACCCVVTQRIATALTRTMHGSLCFASFVQGGASGDGNSHSGSNQHMRPFLSASPASWVALFIGSEPLIKSRAELLGGPFAALLK